MAALTNTQISVTYVGLIKTSGSTVLSSTAQQLTDGGGTASPLYLSTTSLGIGGSPTAGKELDVTGNVLITGDIQIDNINIDGNTISATSGVVTLQDGTIATTQSQGDNSTKLATTAYVDTAVGDNNELSEVLANGNTTGGTDIAVSAGDDITFTSTSKAIFGASSDLQVYSDGSNNYIDSTSNELIIRSNDLRLLNYGTGKYITADAGADVSLYYNNSKKFETTADGVEVTGDAIISSQLTVGASASTDAPTIKAISASTSENILLECTDTTAASAPDLVLYRNAGAISDSDTLGVLEFRGRNNADSGVVSYGGIYSRIINATNQHSAITFSTNYGGTYTSGGMAFHSVGANTPRVIIGSTDPFAIPSDTLDVNGTVNISGDTVIESDLTVGFLGDPYLFYTDVSNSRINVYGDTRLVGGGTRSIEWFDDTPNTVAAEIKYNTSTDAMTFYTNSDVSNAKMTIDSSGNVEVNGTLIDLDSSANATVAIDRGATTDDAIVSWRNAGSEYFRAGLDNTDSNLWSLLHTCGSGLYFDGSNMLFGFGISDPSSYDSNANNIVVGSTGANDKNGITIVGGDTDGRGAIYFADTTQNSAGYITYLHSNNSMLFGTDDSTRITIDSSGNVSMEEELYLKNGKYLRFERASGSLSIQTLGIESGTDDVRLLTTGAFKLLNGSLSTLMHVTNSGNVGIGTTSPYKLLTITQPVGGTVVGQSEILRIAGTQQAVGNKNEIGFANYAENYNASVVLGAEIKSTAGYLIQDFYIATRAGSTDVAPTERMRITSGGDVLIDKQSLSAATVGFEFESGGIARFTKDGGTTLLLNRLTNDGVLLDFRKDTVQVGTISTNGNSLPSDRDFKKDITDLELGLDFVNTLNTKKYRYKISDDNSPLLYGIIAQDLEQSLLDFGVNQNEAVLLQSKEKESEQDSGYSLDYLKLTPVLINAIKELKADNDSLRARIEALEN